MIIGITGHTSGIGKAITNWYTSKSHVVMGFSRANGYDIKTIDPILEAAMDCDVFINNAFHGMKQVDLLYALYDKWKDMNKIILNISSNAGDGIRNHVHPYSVHKAALDKAVEQLQAIKTTCKIMNLRPGWVDTPRVKKFDTIKMTPEYIADVVGWMIDQPHTITTLTVLP